MKKIVVTGATGFIGVHIIEKLLDNDYEVYAVVRPNSRNIKRLPNHRNLKCLEIDICDIKELTTEIREPVEAFYHLAWEGTRVPHRDNKELQKRNYYGAIGAMETAIELQAKYFIGSGSQAEYGKFNGKVDESYPCNPVTEYGKAKYKAYCKLFQMAKQADMKFIWTRIFSVYGMHDCSQTLIMSCIDKMQKNQTVQMTEGVQYWDYIYIDDLTEAFVMFLKVNCKDGVYNIASGKARHLKEYVEEIKEILKSKSIIEYGAVPYEKDGSRNFQPVVKKIEEALNWSAHTSFEDGIKLLLKNKADINNES